MYNYRYKFTTVLGFLSFVLVLLNSAPVIHAQARGENYNQYYRFPLSIGLCYQTLTPLKSYNSDYTIFEISGDVRYPLPKRPVLQPFANVGIIRFDSTDPTDPEKWDHTNYFGSVGIAYSNRFAKNFEVGAEVSGGYSYAVFPQAVDTGSVGSSNLLFGAAGKISLNPSYSLSIDVKPSFKYLVSLSSFEEFNGPLLGIGFLVNYRFGEDPDSARAIIRSLKFEELSMRPVFSAMQSYYVKNPVGTVKVANTEKYPVGDLEVSFYQAGYMEAPTVSRSIPELESGKSVEVPLLASYNKEVFSLEGVTPLTGEIVVKYKVRGRAAEQRQSVSYDMYDKTAITWDDDRKVGAFITPADSALKNYASFINQTFKGKTIETYNLPVQFAMQAFGALAEIGILYQSDPASPFTQMQGNAQLVDSVSLPRETLKRITGDCDDLTVLYCALLEAVNIETGFITVPGHIYAAFNTKIQGNRYRDISPDRTSVLSVDGEVWVPVEITLIGKGDFMEAWRRGSELWNAYEGDQSRRKFYRTREAQSVYRPVGLRETDLGLQYGDRDRIVKFFDRDFEKLSDVVLAEYVSDAKRSNDKKAYNRLGLAYVRLGRYDDAENAFNRSTQIDRNYLTPRLNLGNIACIRKNYDLALKIYQGALDSLQKEDKVNTLAHVQILLNMALVYHEKENYQRASEFLELAKSIDPQKVEEYAYLGTGAGASDRAAEAGTGGKGIIFFDGEQE